MHYCFKLLRGFSVLSTTFRSLAGGGRQGTVIRCLRRLEELLRQLGCAAGAIGNSELQAKFGEAGERIKRDIVFAASLYL